MGKVNVGDVVRFCQLGGDREDFLSYEHEELDNCLGVITHVKIRADGTGFEYLVDFYNPPVGCHTGSGRLPQRTGWWCGEDWLVSAEGKAERPKPSKHAKIIKEVVRLETKFKNKKKGAKYEFSYKTEAVPF